MHRALLVRSADRTRRLPPPPVWVSNGRSCWGSLIIAIGGDTLAATGMTRGRSELHAYQCVR